MEKIEIRVDTDRLSKEVSVDDYIALEDGKIKGIRNVVSYFVFQDGKMIARDKALKLLGALSIEQLGKLGMDFIQAAEEAASGSPKAEKESTEPTLQS